MNIYEKLAAARAELKAAGIKQSGKNGHTGYTYFDLADILPETTRIEKDLKMLSVVRYGAERATLTIYNAEKPDEFIEFSSPMSTAELKGCHAVQNLGAVETYVRRYLYLAAYEIVETETLDKTQGRNEKQGEKKPAQAPANRAPSPTPKRHCEVCGKEIDEKLYKGSLNKYGAALCGAECLAEYEYVQKQLEGNNE